MRVRLTAQEYRSDVPILSESWNIELEAGVGAAWLDYDKYICKRCGDLVEHKKEVRILPTKAAINLVYLF